VASRQIHIHVCVSGGQIYIYVCATIIECPQISM
jgi:hypothetical protein